MIDMVGRRYLVPVGVCDEKGDAVLVKAEVLEGLGGDKWLLRTMGEGGIRFVMEGSLLRVYDEVS